MHSYYVSLLRAELVERKLDQSELLVGTGLSSLEFTPSTVLPAKTLNSLFSNAAKLSGDSQLGVTLGGRVNMLPPGVLGNALITSPTVGDAIRIIVRYLGAVLPGLEVELMQNEAGLALVSHRTELPLALERLYVEILFGAIVTSGRVLVGDKVSTQESKVRLELNYDAPYDRAHYLSVFGSNVVFGAARCALCFDKKQLETSISSSNHLAQQVFRRECDRTLAHDNLPQSTTEQVTQLLLGTRRYFLSCADAARRLNVSESTLRRQLAQEGVGFQSLLDQTRRNLAVEYLQGTRLPIAEIASLLGFSDSANFRRAFKRWTNSTPSSLRTTA